LRKIGDEETIDRKIIIGDHLYFETISSAEFPPLYNEQDFETLSSDDFLAIIEEPDGSEMPGQSLNWLDLYVNASDPILMKLLEPFGGEYCRALIMSGLPSGTR